MNKKRSNRTIHAPIHETARWKKPKL